MQDDQDDDNFVHVYKSYSFKVVLQTFWKKHKIQYVHVHVAT